MHRQASPAASNGAGFLSSVSGVPLLTIPATAPARWRPDHDGDLRALVAGGRPLLLVGRAAPSAGAGAGGALDAARDVHRAASALACTAGLDVGQVLPPVEELSTLFREHAQAAPASSEPAAFRFLLVDMPGSGVRLCLAAATRSPRRGGNASADPLSDVLRQVLRDRAPRPTGLFASGIHRCSATLHGHSLLYRDLNQLHRRHGAWAGDGSTRRWNFNDPSAAAMLSLVRNLHQVESDVMRAKQALRRPR